MRALTFMKKIHAAGHFNLITSLLPDQTATTSFEDTYLPMYVRIQYKSRRRIRPGTAFERYTGTPNLQQPNFANATPDMSQNAPPAVPILPVSALREVTLFGGISPAWCPRVVHGYG